LPDKLNPIIFPFFQDRRFILAGNVDAAATGSQWRVPDRAKKSPFGKL
jgi:hypothetical protein